MLMAINWSIGSMGTLFATKMEKKKKMAKVTISRLFEISNYLKTSAGQQLQDALNYLSNFVEVTVRNLKNGLTFTDNFLCEVKLVSLQNDLETVILPNSKSPVTQIMIKRVINDTFFVMQTFGWKYNSSGSLVVKASFVGTPPPGTNIAVELIIFFG